MLYVLREEGTATNEFALALAAVVIAVVGMLVLLGPSLGTAFYRVATDLWTLSP